MKMEKMVTFNAGHAIGIDPGAVSPIREKYGDKLYTEEAKYVLEIAEWAKKLWIEKFGQKGLVIQNDSLKAICDVANAAGSDVFASIHCNSFSGISATGIETLYYSTEGEKIAKYMQNELIYRLKRYNRGVKYRGDLYVLKQTFAPAILIECGFISNPEEEAEMNTESYKRNLAIAICNALALYFGIEPYHG